ncbi:unnamed protein product [Didymodactylos carnosus]|uniref:Uncharacterized protein n=1 Tax=Didymodactylos carnosus TaxID=1234261 RepID=A0A814ZWU4_9BILA|nr:unnamed protein product [Didymodactylos carnosus]CAF4014204.1 unnamed protein product [Didymodactylos carnosus]
MEFNILKNISEQIESLCLILNNNRFSLKQFCDNLSDRWHLTTKEFLRNTIKTQKFQLHTDIKYNERKLKQHTSLLEKTQNSRELVLADIPKIIEKKNLILMSIETKQDLEKLLNRLEIIYNLTISGLNHIEHFLMNTTIEQMNYLLISTFYYSIIKLYENGENVLFKQLTTYLDSENNDATTIAFDVLKNISKLEEHAFEDLLNMCKQHIKKFI